MTDYSKLTDEEINAEVYMSIFPYMKMSGNGVAYDKPNGTYIEIRDYFNDNEFCFDLIKQHFIELRFDEDIWQCRRWQKVPAIPYYGDSKNLNRAILECYLQIVDAEQAVVV